jgi:hypothetical protein
MTPETERETVSSHYDTVVDWCYANRADALGKLYEKNKAAQWNAATDIDWTIAVDPERLGRSAVVADFNRHDPPQPLDDKKLVELRHHVAGWMISNFLHGEQGALLATAQIVNTVPWTDAKLYAAAQVADEARHVEVYRRYLHEKLELAYPVNPHLGELLRNILSESRWDMTYLGMQIIVEGMALAAFGYVRLSLNEEPLIRQITELVMRDEARHVAFGMVTLDGYFDELSASERKEREDFVIEACTLMRERLLMTEVWERVGLDGASWSSWARNTPLMRAYHSHLFGKIVPNLKQLGLFTPRVQQTCADLGLFATAPPSRP